MTTPTAEEFDEEKLARHHAENWAKPNPLSEAGKDALAWAFTCGSRARARYEEKAAMKRKAVIEEALKLLRKCEIVLVNEGCEECSTIWQSELRLCGVTDAIALLQNLEERE